MATPTIIGTSKTEATLGASTTATISDFTMPNNGDANTMLVAIVSSTGGFATGVTWNGTSMTAGPVGPAQQLAYQNSWYLANPATGNLNLIATFGSSIPNKVVCVFALKDAKQTSPIDANVTNNNGSATTSATTITNSLSTTLTLLNASIGSAASAETNIGNGVTIGSDTTAGADTFFAYNADDSSGGLSVGYTWTTAAGYDFFAFGIKYVASGTNYTSTLTETMVLVPSAPNGAGKVATETLTLTGTITRGITRTLSEVLSLIDTVFAGRFFSATLTETITLVPSFLLNGTDVIWAHVTRSAAAVWTKINRH